MTYGLVKLGDKQNRIKHKTVPMYFSLEKDGNGNYNIISAIVKDDKSIKNKQKKEALIYSKQGEGFATTSNGGAVRYSPNNNVGVKTSSLPTSVKSNTSSTNSISENQAGNKEKADTAQKTKQRSFVDVKTAKEELLKAFGLKRKNADTSNNKEEKPKKKKRILNERSVN